MNVFRKTASSDPLSEKKNSKPISSIFTAAYICILFCVYPFYMNGGYVDIGMHKYFFFLYVSLGAVALIGIFSARDILLHLSLKDLSLTSYFAILFFLETVLSFVISPFRSDSFLGAEGWYMGTLTLCLLFILFLLIRRSYIDSVIVIYMMLACSAIVYILGILDRFSIYIIPLEIRNPSFISTLGNINWFMGYYSVLTPIGIGFFMYELGRYLNVSSRDDQRSHSKIPDGHRNLKIGFLSVYVLIAFMAGLSQGSESVFLFFFALCVGLLYLCQLKIFRPEYFFLLMGLLGAASQGIRLLRVFLPRGYNYEIDGACALFTGSDIPFIVGMLCLLICYALRNFSKRPAVYERICRYIIRGLFICIPVSLLCIILIGILKTDLQMFDNINSSLFSFDENFGSGRGEAYKAAFMAFREMPFVNKLFGIGPDSFASYVYSVPHIFDELHAFWPNDRLTNAHCEMLTMLINQGITGAVLYAGFFISFITGSIKKIRSSVDKGNLSPLLLAVTLSVFCYLIHDLISFATVLNLPFVMVLMAASLSSDL